jgi:hypothetical protein
MIRMRSFFLFTERRVDWKAGVFFTENEFLLRAGALCVIMPLATINGLKQSVYPTLHKSM